jgi:hypothetical protein
VAAQHTRLSARLAALEAHNAELAGTVRGQRAEADALVRAVEARLEDLRAAAALLVRLDDHGHDHDHHDETQSRVAVAAAATQGRAEGAGASGLAAETRALAALARGALPAG